MYILASDIYISNSFTRDSIVSITCRQLLKIPIRIMRFFIPVSETSATKPSNATISFSCFDT